MNGPDRKPDTQVNLPGERTGSETAARVLFMLSAGVLLSVLSSCMCNPLR